MSHRFSIILPTHNRSDLLRFSLTSIVEQTFEDIEIIVSDDQSTDDTSSIIEEIGRTRRVKHITTPNRMTMADHFEWASQQTTGEYVMFLCDDDVLAPDAVKYADRAIRETNAQVVAYNSGVYIFPNWSGAGDQNTLSFTTYTPEFAVCESQKVLQGLFAGSPNFLTPRSNNSFCHRDVIAEARSRNGRFFLHPAPDMSSCSAVLGIVPSYTLIGPPLHIWGVSQQSLGAIQAEKGGEELEKSKEAFGKKDFFELSPFDVYCPANIWAESLLQVRKLHPSLYPDFNFSQLYVDCREHLIALGEAGYKIDTELEELEKKKKTLGLSVSKEQLVSALIRTVGDSTLGKALIQFKHVFLPPVISAKPEDRTVLIGNDVGFSNILESVKFLPSRGH